MRFLRRWPLDGWSSQDQLLHGWQDKEIHREALFQHRFANICQEIKYTYQYLNNELDWTQILQVFQLLVNKALGFLVHIKNH